MTAPAESRMPLAFDSYLGLGSSYNSPASTAAFDPDFSWDPMPPHQESDVAQTQRRSSKLPSVTASEEPQDDGGLIFITGASPADFKTKTNMNIVRKKAMDSFLKGDGKSSSKSKSSAGRSRFSSVDSESRGSNKSKLSVVSLEPVTESSAIPTTISHGAESVVHTRASSPSRSSVTPSSHDQDTSGPEGAVVRKQQSGSFVLPAVPIFLRCEKGVPIPYDAYMPQPFQSIGKSLDPFRTMFQASHPGVSVEELKFHCSRYFGTRALGKYWIPTALSYPHTFLGTLCLATAYHDVIHELELESVQTIALRQEVIHLVGRNMLDPETRVSDHNIMAIIQLIISEVIGREESGLTWHENGIEGMICQRGGLEKLGVNGRLASAISWVSLAASVLREERPRAMYADYCAANSTRQYRPTATLPESPIYCPRAVWKTIPKSTKCTPKAQELLGDIRTMIDSMLNERRSTRRNSQTLMDLYKKITSPSEYPPVSEIRKSRLLTCHDYKYEAIRITSIIQATAIMRRKPLSEVLSEAADLPTPAVFYNTSGTAPLNEPLVSPHDTGARHSTSPTILSYDTNPTMPQSYFSPTDPRSSMSSINPSRPSVSSATSAPRPSVSSTHSTSSDHIYFPAPPAPAPSNTTTLLKDLRATIENSNISACWGDMAGVLLWIGLVVGAASKKSESKIHRKYFSALTMRAGVMLCFEHPESIHSTMVKMCEVVEALGAGKQRKDEGAGKRRRV
ncbi:hypothetical protein HBH56_037160 [Parastagonospora nodorum]|uniref:Transcription factor domain-containing protein n=1 Tax=Phaeosphaeria nodorum (strain SN15 / ATCC MYA-4574 / FGSC 10173) TaxID=321614 RepID=A0A7U2F7D1_PHANO|nr:hypothetical protein HBH56_037160 [Parastagonospora nodorum]QRC99971.1 hypothetical protein JI435_068940 [Parastagonospora nodorum SN15]KAH3933990.1 hypothetical protein HBH54_062310 [Parastagonospora nodorum]KAH4002084.1 hypothetical protein HBI10_079280 [Parastagonospora nodorum]KAH4032014.1 hypothetical protein HBI13_018920 [Parastagonospora nodorum]